MSSETDALYSKRLPLLALKGRVTVHFIDGSTLEGEFATQDAYNIFLDFEDGPMMIPRSQVKFIKGKPGQPIETDTFYGDERSITVERPIPSLPVQEKVEPVPPEEEEEKKEKQEQEQEEEQQQEQEEEEEEEEGTVILKPEVSDMAMPVPAGTESNDRTLIVIEETTTDEEDEDTYVFAQKEKEAEQVRARLICTGGPHAGEVFKLASGIAVLGRSTESTLSLSRDKEVSRRHAIIVQEADKFFIQDQNSLNGTFVNDELVKGSRYLKDRDIILIGLSTLEYRQE
jgi:hypothetical protein